MAEIKLFVTNCQKILSFLIKHPDKEFFDREISKLTGISRSGTNFALRDLAKTGLVLREKRGRMYFYKVPGSDVLVKQLKILQNIVLLRPLIEKLKKISLRIILYGSAGKGENVSESDLDIFIMTRVPEDVKKYIFKDKLREKIQYVIKSPNEFAKSKRNNPSFYREINSGIVLWDGR